jgi:hypothetical protein
MVIPLTFIDAYEQQYQERMLKNLQKKAQALGLELIPISTPNECVSWKYRKSGLITRNKF